MKGRSSSTGTHPHSSPLKIVSCAPATPSSISSSHRSVHVQVKAGQSMHRQHVQQIDRVIRVQSPSSRADHKTLTM
eukprot:scaffold164245_cov23-Tisochrysis_lutea.AAC.1